MSTDVYVQTLRRFETADDGSSITIIVEDFRGRVARILLPIDCLTSLLMTLPEMLTSAVQQGKNDPSLRVVFPMGRFDIELGSLPDTRILTMATPDGFSVSFSLSEGQYRELCNVELGELRPPGGRILQH